MLNLPRYDVFKRKMLADPGEISRGLSENFGEHQQSDVVVLIYQFNGNLGGILDFLTHSDG